MRPKALLLAWLVLCWCRPAVAGTIVHKELASLGAINVLIVDGSLGYHPIPGLDREALAKDLKATVVHTLEKSGLSLSDQSETRLVVEVGHDLPAEVKDYVAVTLVLQLEEPAHLSARDAGDVYVSTWVDSGVRLVSISEAGSTIREIVEVGAQSFAEAVRRAKNYEQRSSAGSQGAQQAMSP